MSRAQLSSLSNVHDFKVPVASPEDVFILKLEWYRMGGEVSERQWNDVSRLVKLLGKRLDVEYLRQGAEEVGVADLLQRLRESCL